MTHVKKRSMTSDLRYQIGNRVALAFHADKLQQLEGVSEFSNVKADVKAQPANDPARQDTKTGL